MQLLRLSHAGGSAMAYARWRRLLPAAIKVVPVELPGRGARMDEPFATDPHRLARALAGELGSRLAKPYALFGHSLGALIAFELAHALIARGEPAPSLLIASGTEAPSLRDDSGWRRPRTDAELIAELRAMGGTPEEAFASAELMEAVLPVLRADFLLCGAYAYRPRAPAMPDPGAWRQRRRRLAREPCGLGPGDARGVSPRHAAGLAFLHPRAAGRAARPDRAGSHGSAGPAAAPDRRACAPRDSGLSRCRPSSRSTQRR